MVEAFLTLIYNRGDPSYPPLGTVVTLSSPLRGAPLAAQPRPTVGRVAVAAIALLRGATSPIARTPAVRDLAPDSLLMRARRRGRRCPT